MSPTSAFGPSGEVETFFCAPVGHRQVKGDYVESWQPHPMNKRYDLRYLTGGDDTFGPDFGGAVIHTVVRKGYLQQCPNVGRFLRNLSFTGAMENDLMDGIQIGRAHV